MYIVMNPKAKLSYVAAIYQIRKDAEEFVDTCHNKENLYIFWITTTFMPYTRYAEMEKCNYPFFILERHYEISDAECEETSRRTEVVVKSLLPPYPLKTYTSWMRFAQFETFQNLKELYSMINVIQKIIPLKDPEDEHYLTLYSITKNFEGDPKKPGNDYMGMLEHKHFDKNRLLAITSCDDIISNGV